MFAFASSLVERTWQVPCAAWRGMARCRAWRTLLQITFFFFLVQLRTKKHGRKGWLDRPWEQGVMSPGGEGVRGERLWGLAVGKTDVAGEMERAKMIG